MSKRNREKRRHRSQAPKDKLGPGLPRGDAAEVEAFLKNFERLASMPEPESWPGTCDASLARPDRVKYAYADFALKREPGRSKFRKLERGLLAGVLKECRDLDHWAMEEFLWHGLPGDAWPPLEAFLEQAGEQFTPAARDQLRLWRQARVGFFEVGPVSGDLVTLRPWSPITESLMGPEIRAICLGIGGVNSYREQMDKIQLSYVAPWSPEQGVYCAMGYGIAVPPELAPILLPLLSLRKPEVVARPVPWKASPSSLSEHARIWRQRFWHDWLAERIEFPFETIYFRPNSEIPEIFHALSLIPSSREEAHNMGIYFEAASGDRRQRVVMGATNVVPADPLCAAALPLAEYRAYRDLVGPPPGTRRMPGTLILNRGDDD